MLGFGIIKIYVLVQKADDSSAQTKELLKNLKKLEDENSILKMKIEELESKLKSKSSYSDGLFSEDSISEEEKENLKEKISDLISKLDNHLRS